MDDIQVYQAVMPNDPAPVYIFAADFQHASLLVATDPIYCEGCRTGPVVMTNITGRLRQGAPNVAHSTWTMVENGYTGIATYDPVGGWQPRSINADGEDPI